MFKNPCSKRKIFFTISIVLVAISVLSMIFRQFNPGIDFTSGTTFEFTLPQGYEYTAQMEEEVKALVTAEAGEGASTHVQKITSSNLDGMFIKTSELDAVQQNAVIVKLLAYFGNEAAAEELATEIVTENASELATQTGAVEPASETESASEEATTEAVPPASPAEPVTEADEATEAASEEATEEPEPMLTRSMIKTDQVSASTSSRLIGDTFKAVVLAIILMLAYISIRFDFKSGVCAVVALAHDVILMFGFYSLFQLTINTSFVAAVLTIIGYSINATIIVFDRVRENMRTMKKTTFDEKANAAIRSSYTRTLFSSLTTLFTIGALYVLGVSSIREFALPIIVGIVCGAYSSLFVAPTLWGLWKESSAKDAKKSK